MTVFGARAGVPRFDSVGGFMNRKVVNYVAVLVSVAFGAYVATSVGRTAPSTEMGSAFITVGHFLTFVGIILFLAPWAVALLFHISTKKVAPTRAFGWRPYVKSDSGRYDRFCVVCNQKSATIRHEFGRELLVAGFVIRKRSEGSVVECSDCDEADAIDAGLRWDKYDIEAAELEVE